MNKEILEKFITNIKEIEKNSDRNEVVSDKVGQYNKVAYIERVITEARELIKHGEKRIALENMLDNLNEVGIVLDAYTICLARGAFGDNISSDMDELLLEMMCE